MMKKYSFGIVSAFFAVFLFCSIASAAIVDRIVAVVNDDIITLTDLNKALSPYVDKINAAGYSAQKRKKIMYNIRKDMINRMVDQKLTDQEVKRLHVTVSDKEVDNAIERFKQSHMMTQEDLEKGLKQAGMTFKEYREKIRQEILRPKLINYTIKSKVIITDQDIKKYYMEHKQEFKGITKYHLFNICIRVDSDASDGIKSEKKTMAEKIKKMLDNGDDFKTLAKKYSELPNASNGGDLGMLKLDTFSNKIRDAVTNLKQGQYTDVILTDYGYQIFYVEGMEKEKGKTLAQVSDMISDKLYKKIVEKRFKQWLSSLKEKAHIKIML